MKLKTDFVTNSSSASFILNIITTDSKDLFDFENSWKDYIEFFVGQNRYDIERKIKKYEEYMLDHKNKRLEIENKIKENKATDNDLHQYKYRYKHIDYVDLSRESLIKRVLGEYTIKKGDENNFTVETWRSMYNDYNDIPEWMRYLVIFYNIDPTTVKKEFGFENIKLEIEDD